MYRIFSIPIPNMGEEEAEMNRFLSSHRIVSVKTQWVMNGEVPYEVFTVEYSGARDVDMHQFSAKTDVNGDRGRVDYRKQLTQEQFVRYCKMRDERKKIADEESVKAFVVFTNEQLAAIARIEKPTVADLKKIEGIGESRMEKYGARILTCFCEEAPQNEQTEDMEQQV